MARSASARDPYATSAMVDSSAGLITAREVPSTPPVHSPSMNIRVGRSFTVAVAIVSLLHVGTGRGRGPGASWVHHTGPAHGPTTDRPARDPKVGGVERTAFRSCKGSRGRKGVADDPGAQSHVPGGNF